MRPDRLDRHIGIDRPDVSGREDIIQVRLRPLRPPENTPRSKLSHINSPFSSLGFLRTDIANVWNDAALHMRAGLHI